MGTDGSCAVASGMPTGLYAAPGSLYAPGGRTSASGARAAGSGGGTSASGARAAGSGGGEGGGNWLERLFVFDPGALEAMRREVANGRTWR